jgi:hypothetical protein
MVAPVAAPSDTTTAPAARERGHRILHDRRLLALLLAGGVMATIFVFVVGFSGAFFTAESSDRGSTITAGELQVNQSKTGAIWTNTTALRPGYTQTGTITITNAKHKAKLTLGVSGLSDTPPGATLADVIVVTVRETSPGTAQRYKGKLKDLTGVALGTWASGEQRTHAFDLAWPASETSLSRAGVTTAFVFDWDAVSVP